jgi:hypothetical protein
MLRVGLIKEKIMLIQFEVSKHCSDVHEPVKRQPAPLVPLSTFQQDNDTTHTAKTMEKWLQDKSLNVLEWAQPEPGLEPDRTSL